MSKTITVVPGTQVFTSIVGHYGLHYKNESKYLAIDGRELQVVSGLKIAKHPGFTAVLLPADVVSTTGLPSAVAWIQNEPTS
jgi:hypothetical protein